MCHGAGRNIDVLVLLHQCTIYQGYYHYPNSGYPAPDFFDAPDISKAGEIAMAAKLD